MMSLVFEGRLNCFKPVTYMSRADVTQIRPLLYIGEQRSANLAGQLDLPVVKSTCPMDHTSKRQEIKILLRRLKRDNPNIENSIFRSIHNVAIDTMPGYRSEGVDHSFLERFNAMENH